MSAFIIKGNSKTHPVMANLQIIITDYIFLTSRQDLMPFRFYDNVIFIILNILPLFEVGRTLFC